VLCAQLFEAAHAAQFIMTGSFRVPSLQAIHLGRMQLEQALLMMNQHF
jgi:hypothetical protein